MKSFAVKGLLEGPHRHLPALALVAMLATGALTILSASDRIFPILSDFRVAISLVFFLSSWLVVLLNLNRIDQRLEPLERRIEQAYLGVSQGGGSARREDVGRAALPGSPFDLMAGRLQKQLRSQATLLEIDRVIHSAPERDDVIDGVLTRIRDIYDCDSAALAMFGATGAPGLRVHVSHGNGKANERFESDVLYSETIDRLAAHPEHMLLDLQDGTIPCLEPMMRSGVQRCLVLPLVVKARVAGFLALGHADATLHDPESVSHLRHLADQIAIAIGNLETVHENQRLSNYDHVTQLSNRRSYRENLEKSLRRARYRNQQVASCVLGLDGFKRINDTFGQEGGDLLLREVARRLKEAVRFSDAVASSSQHAVSRLGGDEFTIMLSEITDAQDSARVARRILDDVVKPFTLHGHEVVCSGSMGIAVFPVDGDNADALIKSADTAMYCAKTRGRNNFQFYASSMNAEASRKLHLEARLRKAFDRGEFVLYYQPVHAAEGEALVAAEALLRWDDPEMGIIGPDEFIPVAEETGLIVPLGEWVFRTACEQYQTWQAEGHESIRISINLSAYQLRERSVIEMVAKALRETELEAGQVELEITETAIMQDDEATTKAFHDINAMGVGLALDDFGTGYSSLSYLRRFPLTRLKIDRSFVKEIPSNQDDRALTSAIISLAHSMRLGVVAEGVETREQANFLREKGCDELQGFLFSPAVPAEKFSGFLAKKGVK